MTKKLKIAILSATFVLSVSAGATFASTIINNFQTMPFNVQVAEATSRTIYDMLSPSVIEFYETNISKQPVISNIRPNKLKKMAERLSVTEQKYKAMLILQDLAAKTGEAPDIKTLAEMSDGELFKRAKKYLEDYKTTLSPEELEQLKNNFNKIKK